ncbi:hypothetical protein EGI22_22070 [Lacihabitans sp. LS3-19]|nr:hypothetical protein [Lacihabitans sp. LS3-19]
MFFSRKLAGLKKPSHFFFKSKSLLKFNLNTEGMKIAKGQFYYSSIKPSIRRYIFLLESAI